MNTKQLKERLEFLNLGIDEDMRAIRNLTHRLEKMVEERSNILAYLEAEIKRKEEE